MIRHESTRARLRWPAGAIAALASAPTFAEAPALATGGSAGVMTLMLNLALVLGIIGVCAFLYSRGRSRLGVAGSELAIVASRQVGNRERLVVLQVGEEQVLIGITANSVSHLHTLSKPIESSDVVATPFAERLRQFGQARGKRDDRA